MSLKNPIRYLIQQHGRLTILTKGLLLISAPVVAQLMLIGLIAGVDRWELEADRWYAHTLKVIEQVDRVLMRLVDVQTGSRGFVLTENPAMTEPYDRAVQELSTDLAELRELVSDNPSQRAVAESIAGKAAEFLEFHAENVRLVESGARDEAIARIAALTGNRQMDDLRREIAAFRAAELRLEDERRQRVESARTSFRWVLVIGTGASLLLAMAMAVAFTRGISRRLDTVTANIQSLAQGTEFAAPVGGSDEITTLDRAFRQMAQSLAQSREEMARHNRVLQSMLDNMADGVVVVDEAGKFLVFNRAAERILGVGPTEGGPREWSKQYHVYLPDQTTLFPPEQLPLVRALRGEEVDAEELFVRNPERSEGTWITVTTRPLRDAQGLARGGVAVFQDVTQRKHAEAERDRFFDLSLDILCISKADGYFKRINPAFSRILGWSEEEILARPFLDFVHPDDRAATLREVERQVVAGQPVLHFENRYQHKDGSWRVLSWRSAPQPGGFMYATARDVTDAKRAEEALRRSEQNLAITLDSIGDAVIATDAERRITRMNRVAEQMTGWKLAEALGRSLSDVFRIINEETRRPAVIPVDEVLATGVVHGLANHTVLISRDGTERPIADSAAPICDAAGRVTGVVLVFRDVTDERRFEQALQRLNADLERRVVERTADLAESERRHRTLLANLQGMAYRCRHDADWTMEFVSEGCRELLGIEPEELTRGTRTFASLIHPDDLAAVTAQCEAGIQARLPIVHEYRVVLPDGQTKWVWEKARGVELPDGSVAAIEGFITDITERKQIEQALRLLSTKIATLQGVAFYEAVVSHLADLLSCEFAFVCRHDPDHPDELITLAMVADGTIRPNFSYSIAGTPCERVVEDRRSCVFPNGVARQYPSDTFLVDHQIEAYVGVPFFDAHGRQLGHIGVMSRKALTKPDHVEAIARLFAVSVAAEMQRQASERRFSDLFEFSPDAIVITDRDGRIVQANRQVATVFGWTPTELVGQPVEVLVPETLRAEHLELRRRYLESALPRAMGNRQTDLLGLRKDGRVIPVDVSLSPIKTPSGLLVAATVRDVTERQQVLKELQAAKEFADTVINNVSGLFYVLDQNGVLVRWNESLQELLGLSSDQMRRTSVLSLVHEADRERAARKLAEGFADGIAEAEVRVLVKGGEREYLLNGRRLEIDGNVYLVGSGVDITYRKQAEKEIRLLNQTLEERVRERTAELTAANEQLIQASRFKSEFLASMSHELRTPLNGVLGMNELLLKTPLTDKQREYVEASNTSGRALLSLINDVLDISKIEAGKLELDPHDCDLEALAYDVLTMFSHRARQKGVSLTCRLDPEACAMVLCDDNRLRQVLVNLLGNALKFTATGSVILESKCVKRDEQRIVVRLAVTDTGVGIPEDKLNRLFSPFSQVDSSTSRHYGGTGLGLSLSKQLVELMGGIIGVSSRVGVGSTFWVEIPFELVKAELRSSQRKQILKGIKVLAVDGVDRERRQIAVCLESWGCPFQHVGTLREAVDAVAQAEAEGQPFAVILADCRLAFGDEFVHLQNLMRRSDVPVIGLGIGDGNDLATHLRQLGLRHLLRDPILPSALFNALTSVLSVAPPAESPREKSEATADKQAPTFTGHILVAEDNSINQMFVRELLKHFGCTCDIANNGDEALTAVQQKHYDLALMDCQMPEMDGFTAAREIRRREAAGELSGRLPIIALTANALKGDRDRCLAAGMDDYLSKPLHAATLQAMLAKYLAVQSAQPAP